MDDFDKAIELGCARAEAFNNRGVVRAVVGQPPEDATHGSDGTYGTNGTNGTDGTALLSGSADPQTRPTTTDFDRAIEIGPPRAECYNNRGVVHVSRGELEEAIADFDEAIRIYPGFPVAYANRAIARGRWATSNLRWTTCSTCCQSTTDATGANGDICIDQRPRT